MSKLTAEPSTVLDAIDMKHWTFEPSEVDAEDFEACRSLPGTAAKLTILAERVRRGLPLWHPSDCRDCDDLVE